MDCGASGDVAGKEDDDESSSSSPKPENIQSVLDDFREKWHRELKDTAGSGGGGGGLKDRNSNSSASGKHQADPAGKDNHTDEQRARALFLQGSELERDGKVFEAMRLYRRAVQLVPDIESKIYDKKAVPKPIEAPANDQHVDLDELAADLLEAKLDSDEDLENVDLIMRFQTLLAKSRTLFESSLSDDKMMIKTSAHFSDLPMEVILFILRWVVSNELDIRSLERFSTVCRGFYLLARDSEIWKRACYRIWGVNVGNLTGSPFYNWREMYINRPRVHFHGCYISRTSYLRYGENSFQDQFYRPVQLVEYYRYFRFFAGGKVLMLTSAEEPQVCVNRLKPRSPLQNEILKGHYRLHNDEIIVAVQRNRSTMQNQRSNWKKEQETKQGQQTFYLELKISGTGKRAFSQLHWNQYSMVQQRNNQEKTTVFELAPSKYPPLYFSRVRSYHQESDGPLQ